MPPRVLNEGSIVGVSEEVFFHHDRIITDIKKQQTALAGKFKAAKKAMLDDGLDYEDFKYVNRQRGKSIEEQRISHNNRTAYMRFYKMPMGAALQPVAEIKEDVGLTDEERQKKWEDEGYVAGIEGKNRDVCPHDDPNSVAARHWMRGYDAGQAKLGKGIKKKPAEPAPAGPPADEKITPKPEPEVATAKARRASKKGVTYWHNATIGKVYEVDVSQANPEGAVSITREDYDRLAAEYKAKEDADWDVVSKKQSEEQQPAEEVDEDEGGPPAPGAS